MLHSGLMRNLFPQCRLFLLLLPAIILATQAQVFAAESDTLQIRTDQKVIYCAARIAVDSNAFSPTMKDGIAMATEWHIKVRRVRRYWLNEDIADITVIRHAKPDLLTRSWLLTETSSGISRRVYRIEDAIQFLSGLDDFPVLDRSLLQKNRPYRVSVSVEIHSEGISDAWWAGLWQSAAASMQQDFSLP